MVPRFGAVALVLCGAWIVGAGCAANGSMAQVNGPEYDLDAGTDAGENDAITTGDGAAVPPDASPAASDGSDSSSSVPGPTDDAGDASDGAPGSDGGCTSTTAMLGGNDFSIFGATAVGTGTFSTHAITGSVASSPALVAFGGGFQGLFAEAIDAGLGDALYGVAFGSGTWSAPVVLGGGADAIEPPGAAVVGSTVQAVYLNADHSYFHATYSGAWDTGADPVRPPNDAGVQAFGPVGASAAGTATQLVIAYEGYNSLPYAQTWTSGSGWDDGVPLGTAMLAANTPMAIVPLGAGTNDLLVVFVEAGGACTGATDCLYAVFRDASTKGWSASPTLVDPAAYSPSGPTLAAMSAGRALLAWAGGNGEGYESVYTAGTSSWSTPAQITSAQVASAPSLATGVCGDDAVAAYISTGNVYTTHFAGGAWTIPAALTGGAGSTSVSIATAP